MTIDKSIITFRQASFNDIETLIDYRIIFLKEAQHNPTPELELHVRQSLRQYFTKSLENDSFVALIADYENKSIAFGGMVLREQPGNFEVPNGKTGYILNMFTIKDFRRNGIGSLLFQKLIDIAKQKKLDRLELHATKDGEPIYRHFGLSEPHDKVLEMIFK